MAALFIVVTEVASSIRTAQQFRFDKQVLTNYTFLYWKDYDVKTRIIYRVFHDFRA